MLFHSAQWLQEVEVNKNETLSPLSIRSIRRSALVFAQTSSYSVGDESAEMSPLFSKGHFRLLSFPHETRRKGRNTKKAIRRFTLL